MKIAFIADVHVENHRRFGGPVRAGINERCRQVLRALRGAYREAAKRGCANMVIAGDLFDTTHPNPQQITEVQRIVDEFYQRHGIVTWVVKGNHDAVSSTADDHALGPLEQVAHVVERPQSVLVGQHELWMVPYREGPAREWLPEALSELESKDSGADGGSGQASPVPRILALHLGVEDQSTAPWLRGAEDSVHLDQLRELCRKHGVSWVVAGNWHDPRLWRAEGEVPVSVVQVGTLAPTGFDNPQYPGEMAVLELDDRQPVARCGKVRVPGPRFVKGAGLASLEETLTDLADEGEGNAWYVSWTVPAADLENARQLRDNAVESGTIAAGEVFPSGEEAASAARSAAHSTRAASTLTEAVEQYLSQCSLPEGVDRRAVGARVRRYLGV